MPTSIIETLRYESQEIEEFSKIGFLIAQEISRFIYKDETSSIFVEKNVDFKGDVKMHSEGPTYSEKVNIVVLSDKVR